VRSPGFGLVWRQIFSTSQTEVVGPKKSQSVELDAHISPTLIELIVDPSRWAHRANHDYLVLRDQPA
jgi:hypothetical protein